MVQQRKKKDHPPLILGITGASGGIYGAYLAKVLQTLEVPFYLVMSEQGERNLGLEPLPLELQDFKKGAQEIFDNRQLGATIASGSFLTRGMIIVPCSVGTLSAVATSRNDTLISRAADVTLKERRPLILAVRETPFHAGHLRLMQQVNQAGGIIAPPIPAFYHKPTSLEEVILQSVGKWLDMFGIAHQLFKRWSGEG